MITIRQAKTSEEVGAAIDIQLRVFADEQGISETDCRHGNDDAVHILATDGRMTMATARLRAQDGGVAEVARVAVLPEFRGSGLGKRLVIELESIARNAGMQELLLHPHAYLEEFYAGLGYAKTGDAPYEVGEYAIITMRKPLADGNQHEK